MHERANFLFAFFAELRRNEERNYKVLPSGLERPPCAIHGVTLGSSRIVTGNDQVYLSYLRVFAGWIGKDGMVLEPPAYVSDPVLVQRTHCADVRP